MVIDNREVVDAKYAIRYSHVGPFTNAGSYEPPVSEGSLSNLVRICPAVTKKKPFDTLRCKSVRVF